jgi:hypothetical protein
MTIMNAWYDERKQIVLTVFDGTYTWEDVYQCAQEVNALAAEVNYPVANIIDMSKGGSVPANAASHSKRLRELRHPQIQLEIVVGATSYMKTLSKIGNMIFKVVGGSVPSHFADTREEAVRLVETTFIK